MAIMKLYCYVDESGQDTKGRIFAGFVRDALDGDSKEIKLLFQKAKRDGMLIEVAA